MTRFFLMVAAIAGTIAAPPAAHAQQTDTWIEIHEPAEWRGEGTRGIGIAVGRSIRVVGAAHNPNGVQRVLIKRAQATHETDSSDTITAGQAGLRFGLHTVGAVTANPSRLHGAGGVVGSAEWRGWGLLGVGMLGAGGDYESSLYAAAGTRRVIDGGVFSLAALAGYGLYAEDAPNGAHRDAAGILYGGLGRLRFGLLSIMLMVTDLTGRYAGLTPGGIRIDAPSTFHVVRYTLGVGIGTGG